MGLSADVLGAVIEVASGMRFGDFLESRIFRPLGMQDTGFYVPGEKQGRLACAYEQTETATMKRYTGDNLAISNAMASNPAFESGGADWSQPWMTMRGSEKCCKMAEH